MKEGMTARQKRDRVERDGESEQIEIDGKETKCL